MNATTCFHNENLGRLGNQLYWCLREFALERRTGARYVHIVKTKDDRARLLDEIGCGRFNFTGLDAGSLAFVRMRHASVDFASTVRDWKTVEAFVNDVLMSPASKLPGEIAGCRVRRTDMVFSARLGDKLRDPKFRRRYLAYDPAKFLEAALPRVDATRCVVVSDSPDDARSLFGPTLSRRFGPEWTVESGSVPHDMATMACAGTLVGLAHASLTVWAAFIGMATGRLEPSRFVLPDVVDRNGQRPPSMDSRGMAAHRFTGIRVAHDLSWTPPSTPYS